MLSLEQNTSTSEPEQLAVAMDIPQGLEKLARRYISTRLQELPVFENLLGRSEFDEIRRLSHNLKGTGTSYGFPDITRLAAAMERASKEQDATSIAEQLLSLSIYVQAADKQLPHLP